MASINALSVNSQKGPRNAVKAILMNPLDGLRFLQAIVENKFQSAKVCQAVVLPR
jgi:hypothetical protein